MKTMKKCLLLFVILFNFTSYFAYSQPDMSGTGSAYCHFGKSNSDKNFSDLYLSPNTPVHAFNVLKYTMEADFSACFVSPYPASFTSDLVVKFEVDSVLNSIKLNAVQSSLVINSVGLAGVSFTHTNNILTIQLDDTYQPDDIVEVSVNYSHNNVDDGAFYVSQGFLFTDCEPQGARKWFPCWDQPYDKAIWDITAKVPNSVKLVSNGHIQDSTVVGGSTFYHWVTRDPISTYIISLAAKVNYQLDVINWTSPISGVVTPIRFYYNAGEDPSEMEALIGDVADFFSQTFTDHPFEKNGFATLNSDFSWGGMENQTITHLCPGCWDEMLVVHEFAHQWFGDMITCATWADLWINEGWATYSEALWKEHAYGYASYREEIEGNADYYQWSNPGWAISNPDWAITPPSNDVLFNYAITYLKGACVLHLLRYTLGDDMFFEVVSQYANDTENFKYKNATIMDFATKVNEVTGEDYNWFFEQWIYTPNHPTYANKFQIINAGGGSYNVRFLAKQTQTNTGFFKMPLELKINFSDGTSVVETVFNEYNNQLFEFQYNKAVTSVVFDNDNEIILKEGNTTQSTIYGLEISVNGEGSTTPAAGFYGYVSGSVSVTATPESGWVFQKWLVDGVDVTANPTTVNMNANHDVNAFFVAAELLPVTISQVGQGSIVPQAGSYEYQLGTVLELSATPVSTWHFDHWTINGNTVTDATTSVTIEEATTIEAVFAENTVNIETANGSSIVMYPNPVNNVLQLNFEDFKAEKLKIYNSVGNLVYETEVTLSNTSVNVENLPAGTYFVQIEKGTEVYNSQIVIVR